MLMCQLCRQRQATVHFTRIINGQKVEMVVCEACARESNEIKLNFHQLLSGIMGQHSSKEVTSQPVPDMKCASCGQTIEEFNKTGLLGCPECYITFGEGIQTLLKRIHGNAKHHGKIPESLSGRQPPVINLMGLKQELQRCIREENYEQAAVLRDKIKEAEKLQENEGPVQV